MLVNIFDIYHHTDNRAKSKYIR